MDTLSEYLRPASNVVYVSIVLYGFYKLPANFMLVFGLLTLVIGPYVLGWFLQFLAAVFATAAYAPFIIVFAAWFVVFLKSALFQRLGLALGLDRDGSGQVDSLDVLFALSQTPAGHFLRLHEVWELLTRVPTEVKLQNEELQRPVIERLDYLVEIIAVGEAPKGKKLPPKPVPLPPPAQPPRAGGSANGASTKGSSGSGGKGFLGLQGLPGIPKWASPQSSEAFAAKQRERAQKGKGPGDLV